ncbi:MAG: class I SAM-dependent methyltransferase [Ancrocorticia sp.]|uniref:class I SAM-dependent methyltransferase n=1 Tax=Ancrocorticia sp. TaxID=2593684 RepID=UPI003F926543
MTSHESTKGGRSGPEEKRLQGHWLLAKMGKRVLRPGGVEMTRRILKAAAPASSDRIVEFGPGVGKTAEYLLAASPARYWGVDVRKVDDNPMDDVIAGHPHAELVNADARATGLPDGCATLVVGEAMLTMQSNDGKSDIMREAYRILAPGGRYALHEMGFKPDTPDSAVAAVQKSLSQTIKVGARPLPMAEWARLLEGAGFRVEFTTMNKMALLEVRRVIADEGLLGALKIASNVARNPAARKRIFAMRRTFKRHQQYLCSVGLVAVKP